jgi:predicted RNA-binding protein
MSKGIQGFYKVTETIKNTLLDDVNVNTVTHGDITDIDLSKQTIFPLSHLMVNSATQDERILTFNLSVLAMDIVDTSKEEVTDLFVGNDNLHDVLNTQLAVLNRMLQKLRMSDLFRDKYQLEGSVTCEPFMDRFENSIAGWVATFDVVIENDISLCN